MSKKYLRPVSVIVLIAFLFFPQGIFALPQGEQVIAGSATFDRPETDTLNINVATDKMIANYQSFSIAQPEAVNFLQPSSSSVALNRVVGIDPSSILGTLTATGKIFLINPHGILFGQGCRIDTAGMVASTLNITDNNFLAGRYTFYGQGGSVVNQGYIAAPGGYVSLLGSTVQNTGVIEAELGSVVLASGEAITLNLDPQGLISVVIDEATTQNLEDKAAAVENTGTITADGGKVILTAQALDGVFDRVVNNEGVIKARSLVNNKGEVYLLAEGENALASNTGTIDVSAAESGADGGFVEISGSRLDIESGIIDATTIDGNVGTIRLDPPDWWIGDIEESWFNTLGDIHIIVDAENDMNFIMGNLGGDDILDLVNLVNGSFTANAGRHIYLNDDTVITYGGDIIFNADKDFWYKKGCSYPKQWTNTADGIGDINLGSGALISNGGDITLKAGKHINFVSGSINSAGGNVALVADASFPYNAHETTDDGYWCCCSRCHWKSRPVYGAVGNPDTSDNLGDIHLGTGAGITSAGGDVSLNAVNIYATAPIDSSGSGGDVVLTAVENIEHGPNGDVMTGGGNFVGNAGLNYTLKDAASILTEAGIIDIYAGQNILLGAGPAVLLSNFTVEELEELESRGYILNDWGYYTKDAMVSLKGGEDGVKVSLPSDTEGFYITMQEYVDGTIRTYKTNPTLNPDGREHLRVNDDGTITFNWEDLYYLGDRDFNDVIFQYTDLSGDPVYLGTYLSSSSNIFLTADNGSISQTSGKIYAENLMLSAQAGITGIDPNDAIDTQVSNLSAKNTTGNIRLKNTIDLTIADLSGLTGMNPEVSGYDGIGNGSGTVDISVVLDPDLYVNAPINTNGGDVFLTADRNITHNEDGDIATQGGDFTGNAASGGGLGAYAILAGATIHTFGCGDGDVKIIAGQVTDWAPLTVIGGGDILINGNPYEGMGDWKDFIAVNPEGAASYIITGNGDISGNAYVATQGVNALLYAPNGEITGSNSPLSIKVVNLAARAAGDINLFERTHLNLAEIAGIEGIKADGNIYLGVGDPSFLAGGSIGGYGDSINLFLTERIESTASNGLVDIDVPYGGIYDGTGVPHYSPDLDIISFNLDMLAGDSIGTSDENAAIDTQAAKLWAESASGSIYINELNEIDLINVVGGGSTSVHIISGGDMYVGYVYDTNDVWLTTFGTMNRLSGGLVETQDMHLWAANDINQIYTDVSNIWAYSDTGSIFLYDWDAGGTKTSMRLIDIDAANSVSVFAGWYNLGPAVDVYVDNLLTRNDSGQIWLQNNLVDAGNLYLDNIRSGSAGQGNVKIIGYNSVINNNGDLVNIAGANLDAHIAFDIGSFSDPIDTALDTITAISDNGSMYFNEADNVNLVDLRAQGSVVNVIAGGDILVNNVYANGSGAGDPALVGIISTGGLIDVSGQVLAENLDGFAGIALLALGDIYAGDVLASGGEGFDAIEFLEDWFDVDIGEQYDYSSGILLGSLSGDITLGNITADMVLAAALGGSIEDVGDVYDVHYLGLLAQNNIGTEDNPINTTVDILSAYSWDTGDIYINEADGIELGLYLPLDCGALGASVAANDGIIDVTSDGDMIVNSVVAPRAGVFLETTEGSIYAGRGWCPAVLPEPNGDGIPEHRVWLLDEFLMDVSGTQWETLGGISDFASLMFGAPDLPPGPNVIAGGYSYFSAPNGTIGVGIPPGDEVAADPTVYNPLDVCIQIIDGSPSAFPDGYSSKAGLALEIGNSTAPDYTIDTGDGNGPLGLSGAIMGIVRPGVTAVTGVYPSPDIDLTGGITPPGYIFYDDTDTSCCFALYGPGAANSGTLQIWPEPIDVDFTAYFVNAISKTFRAYYEILDDYRVVFVEPATPTTFYFYHPLTSTDSTAFDEIVLDIDAYEFIAGNIKLKKTLAPYFGEQE